MGLNLCVRHCFVFLGRTHTTPDHLFGTVLKHECTTSPDPHWTALALAPFLLYIIVKCSVCAVAAQRRPTHTTWPSLCWFCSCWVISFVDSLHCSTQRGMIALAISHIQVLLLCAPAWATVPCRSTPLPTGRGSVSCLRTDPSAHTSQPNRTLGVKRLSHREKYQVPAVPSCVWDDTGPWFDISLSCIRL